MDLEKNLDTIIDDFPIDVYSTEKVEITGLERNTSIFKVDPNKSPLIPKNSPLGEPYIISTASGMTIACHPHIVGKELDELCLHSAREFIKVMEAMHSLRDDSFAILHVLRGAPGYKWSKLSKKTSLLLV